MKLGLLLSIILSSWLLGTGFARAGDVSCQVDLLKPKMNAAVIIEEVNKPAKLTVAEAKLRLQNRQLVEHSEPDQEEEQQTTQNDQENNQNSTDKVAAKTAKKTSKLGGIFDILLPSKLRDPVK